MEAFLYPGADTLGQRLLKLDEVVKHDYGCSLPVYISPVVFDVRIIMNVPNKPESPMQRVAIKDIITYVCESHGLRVLDNNCGILVISATNECYKVQVAK
jgi:hypothetical protein